MMLPNFDRMADAAANRSRTLSRVVAGLPSVPSSPRAAKSPAIGSTQTFLDAPAVVMDVANQPSMKIRRMDNGGVEVVIRRNVRFPGLLDSHDAERLERLGADMVAELERYSRGPLNAKELRRRGHPYGRGVRSNGAKRGTIRGIGHVQGVRGSVPDLSVVNRQEGDFEKSWSSTVEVDETGATLTLANDSPYAAYLAFGTLRMKAHGPFTQVPTRSMARLNSEWQRTVRAAYSRKRMEADVLKQLGMND